MLKHRVITALVLVGALLLVLFELPLHVTQSLFAVLIGLAGWEWGGLMRWVSKVRIAYGIVLTVSCLACMPVFTLVTLPLLWLSAVFWIGAVPLWLRMRPELTGRPVLGAITGGAVLLPLWLAASALEARGPWWLLGSMAVVWVADIAAYFAGRQFGRRKLAPSISPGKTWEGVAGALVGVQIYVFCVFELAGFSASTGIPFGPVIPVLLLLTAVSVMGDLFESLIKRQAGVKDSGQLLPGHGGVLDRIDALTSTVPLILLLLILAGA